LKTALAISGGGSKGAFAVGAIEVLREYGYEFDVVAGTSTGALIAPLLAVDEIAALVDVYSHVTNQDIIRLNWRKLFLNGIYDTTPLKQLIHREISKDNRYNKLMRSKCDILLCAVSLQTKELVYFSQRNNFPNTQTWRDQDEFVQSVLASTNQPVFMDLPTINNMQYTDGGIREVIPLGILCDPTIGTIVVIINSDDTPRVENKRFANICQVGLRTLDIMGTEISHNDLSQILERNQILSFIQDVRNRAARSLSLEQMTHIFNGWMQWGTPKNIIVIRPEYPLGFSGLSFQPELMRKAIDMGRETARRILNG